MNFRLSFPKIHPFSFDSYFEIYYGENIPFSIIYGCI